VILIVGLGFGDCGKGSVVDFLARKFEAKLVVRFNGGPQAGHNVVTSDGRHHTFSQFGSATFLPWARTFLSRFVLIEPYAMFNEAAHLNEIGVSDVMGRLTVDDRCPVITPCHQAANRLREISRGGAAHGTCGMGIGEVMQDIADGSGEVLLARELSDRKTVRRKLLAVRDLKVDQLCDTIEAARTVTRARFSIETLLQPSWIEAAVDNYAELARRITIADESAARSVVETQGTILFEGAQGVLLDESFGFHPHTTWSNTTFANAEAILDEAGCAAPRTKLGVLRTYLTRHGPGPMVTEDPELRKHLPEPHNDDAGWQGSFRVGSFDAVAARYALRVAGPVDGLAITFLDRLPVTQGRFAEAYLRDGRRLTEMPREVTGSLPLFGTPTGDDPPSFLNMLRRELNCPIRIASRGPTAEDKYFL